MSKSRSPPSVGVALATGLASFAGFAMRASRPRRSSSSPALAAMTPTPAARRCSPGLPRTAGRCLRIGTRLVEGLVRSAPQLRQERSSTEQAARQFGHNIMFLLFFFNDTATTEIYTLSLHDALPISGWSIYFARSRRGSDSEQGACFDSQQPKDDRSEEHTSELQSQSNLVCRLL